MVGRLRAEFYMETKKCETRVSDDNASIKIDCTLAAVE